MKQLKQILFVPPAPIVWAEHAGLFARHGVEVETTQTLSSDQLGQGLADGTWDVGVGVVDNVIAWNEERKAGLQIMAQLERSMIMAFCAGRSSPASPTPPRTPSRSMPPATASCSCSTGRCRAPASTGASAATRWSAACATVSRR